jgi:hypothetical protein
MTAASLVVKLKEEVRWESAAIALDGLVELSDRDLV